MQMDVYWWLFRTVWPFIGLVKVLRDASALKGWRHWTPLWGALHLEGLGPQTGSLCVGWWLLNNTNMARNPHWSVAESWHSKRLRKMSSSEESWTLHIPYSSPKKQHHKSNNFLFCQTQAPLFSQARSTGKHQITYCRIQYRALQDGAPVCLRFSRFQRMGGPQKSNPQLHICNLASPQPSVWAWSNHTEVPLQKPAEVQEHTRSTKAIWSCKTSIVFTVELESSILIFFFCHRTFFPFILLYYFYSKPKATPCWAEEGVQMAFLPPQNAEYDGAALYFDAALVSFALHLLNCFCLLRLKLWIRWIREKAPTGDCKQSWSFSSTLKINYQSCLLEWAFDKSTEIMHPSTSTYSPAETLTKQISYLIQLTFFFFSSLTMTYTFRLLSMIC